MKITRNNLVLVAVGVAFGATMMSVASVPAHANSGRTAACIWKMPFAEGGKSNDTANLGVQQWMNEQLAAGKTNFTTVVNAAQVQSFCAW